MNGEHPNTRETPTTDPVSVKIAWTEQCSYETTVTMPRTDYERIFKMLDGDEKQARRAEAEIFHKHDLNRVEPYDWDDLEVDCFREVAP